MKKLVIFSIFRLVAVMMVLVSAVHAQECVMVVEAYSGKVLVAYNSSVKRPIASLTKIATAAVAVDWAMASGAEIGTLQLTVPETVTLVGGANPMNLEPGDKLSLRDALYSALLGSDNLAALTIADHVGREILARRGKSGDPLVEFVGEMNRLAKALGMNQTVFANPHGLERKGAKMYSTAADVARMSIYAMRRNAFSFTVRQPNRNVSITKADGKKIGFTIRNTNELIGEPGILGVKTGTTDAAGDTSVSAFIEVKVTPERGGGFDRLAMRIARFEQVVSCYLASGGYDLMVVVEGGDLREVARFVSEKLSSMDGVLSTATHFRLKTYKENGFIFEHDATPERLAVSP